MSKGLFCVQCCDIRMLAPNDLEPRSCGCGNVTGWWLDGRRGVARYTTEAPAYAWGMGFNNSMLRQVAAIHGSIPTTETWRAMHDTATDAPGYFFDKSMSGCWAIFFKPGNVRDVEWATNDERAAVGLPPYPDGHALAPKPASASGGSGTYQAEGTADD